MAKQKTIVGKFHALFPCCKDVTMMIEKEHQMKLDFYSKFKMYFHIYMVCKFCRAFRVQSYLLQKKLKEMKESYVNESLQYELSLEQKTKMQKAIDGLMNN